MKYLESNLASMNKVSLPVDKRHNIAYQISQRVGQSYKIKIVATTFININRWKWMPFAEWANIYDVF